MPEHRAGVNVPGMRRDRPGGSAKHWSEPPTSSRNEGPSRQYHTDRRIVNNVTFYLTFY